MQRLLARSGPGLLGTLAVFAITFLCFRVLHANATVAAVSLLLSVLVTGAYSTLAQAVIAAVAATLCLDYFFIPPVGSITVGDPQGWIVLSVFLAVSLQRTSQRVCECNETKWWPNNRKQRGCMR